MALVGEAHILVRAITTNVEKDIKRAFSNVSGGAASNAGAELGRSFSRGLRNTLSNNIFGQMTKSIDAMAPAAEGANEAFKGMVRSSYTTGTALSVLLGAVSSLIGGLGALVGAAGQAATGLVAMAGAAIALKVGFSVAGLAFKGISQAVAAATKANQSYSQSIRQAKFDAEEAALAVDEASLNLEKAIEARNRVADLPVNSRIRREADLNVKKAELALRKAKDAEKNAGNKAANGGGADPYAGLTPSQKEFAKFLVGLQKQLKELKEAAASGLFPILQTQIERLIKGGLLEILKRRFYDIGQGMGFMAEKFTDTLFARKSLQSLDNVLGNIAKQLPPMGNVFGNLLDGFLKALELADPAIRNFIGYLEKKSGAFADFFTFKGKAEDNPISKFLVDGEKMLERFFGIFGNVFGTLKTLVAANFGPGSGGEIMVTWLEKVTKGWSNMGKDVNGNITPAFKKFFSDAATNTTKILDSIGALIKEFLKLGDMPEIGQTFDILKEGAPMMGDLMRAGIQAGPSLAKLVVQIVRIAKALADSEGPKIFFDTLTSFATKVADILESEVAQSILKVVGRFTAMALALGTVVKVGTFFGNVFMGAGRNITKVFDKLVKGPLNYVQVFFAKVNVLGRDLIDKGGNLGKVFGNFGINVSKVGRFFTTFPGIAIITTLITLFVDLYNHSETFRKTISDTLAGIGAAFGRLWESLKGLFDALFGGEGFGGIMEAIRPFTELIFGTVFPLIGAAINIIIDTISTAINFITTLVKAIMAGVKPLIGGIMDLFSGKLGPGLTKIFGGIAIILLGIFEGIVNAIIAGINILLGVINNLLRAIGDGPIGQFLKSISGGAINLSKINLKVDYVDWTSAAKKNLAKATNTAGTHFAKGGTVFPSNGGSMVTVAEAGRPERIEPLHPNGLSDRDIAIINKLSNGGGPRVQVTVNPSAKMDERELAMQVSRQIAHEIRKGGY